MSTRALAVLIVALLVGGVVTAIVKEPAGERPSAQPTPTVSETPTETPSETPTESPTATMTFTGVAPFESPTTASPTSTNGPLPRTGDPAAWPPAVAALALAGLAGIALRRAHS